MIELHGELAQLEERHVDIVEVAGSSPVLPTIRDIDLLGLAKGLFLFTISQILIKE